MTLELVRKGATFAATRKTNTVKHKKCPGWARSSSYLRNYMIQRDNLALRCFSPLVMIATFLFETVAALIVLVRNRQTIEARLIIALLICLAVFQLAEYMICETALGLSSLDWSRVGWVSISFLPPLGVHLGMAIAKRRNPFLLWPGYIIAVAFSVYFLTVGHGIQSSACLGNYVIFEVSKPALQYYILYYYIWLAVGIAATITYASSIKQRNRRSALRWLGVGYAVFIIPTIAANLIDPNTIQAIPSIMCGFAVLLAAILLFIITPRICSPRKSKKSV